MLVPFETSSFYTYISHSSWNLALARNPLNPRNMVFSAHSAKSRAIATQFPAQSKKLSAQYPAQFAKKTQRNSRMSDKLYIYTFKYIQQIRWHHRNTGLELKRFLTGACRAPRLRNLGARPKIPVPKYISGPQLKLFWRCLSGNEPQKSRCPAQNLGASGTR